MKLHAEPTVQRADQRQGVHKHGDEATHPSQVLPGWPLGARSVRARLTEPDLASPGFAAAKVVLGQSSAEAL